MLPVRSQHKMNVSIMTEEPALFGLIRAGDLRAVSMYLEQFPSDRALPQHGATTALMLCVETMFGAAGSWHQQAAQGQQQGDQDIEDRVRLLTRVAQLSSYFHDRNSQGQTVLHLAAAAGCKGDETVSSILAVVSEAVLECLLPEESFEPGSDGAMVSKAFWIRCKNKQTALHTAIVHRNYKAASLLFKHMIKNKERVYRDYCVLTEDIVPKTLLTIAVEHNASRKFLKLILQQFSQAASISDVYDKLPLTAAIEHTMSPRKLQLLIQAFPAATSMATGDGDLPLHLAAMYYRKESVEQQCEVLQLLLDAYPPAICRSNVHGQWPLHCAMELATRNDESREGDDDTSSVETSNPPTLDLAVVQLLSNHAINDGDDNDNHGEADGSGAAPSSSTGQEVPQAASESGVVHDSQDSFAQLTTDTSMESSLDDVLSMTRSQDKTSAVRKADNSSCDCSIEFSSALLHADCYGELPLHLAARRLDSIAPEALQWLLDMHPEATQIVNEYGHLPLHLAAATLGTTNNLPNLRTLLEAHPAALWQPDHEGDVPLHCAVANHDVPAEVVECLLVQPPFDERFQHPTENSATGQLPLHCACASGTAAKLVDQLIAYHPEALFRYDGEGKLPFHVALDNTETKVATLRKLRFAASRVAPQLGRPATTATLPATANGTPALFLACAAAATNTTMGQDTNSLDSIRYLVEQSPDLFKL